MYAAGIRRGYWDWDGFVEIRSKYYTATLAGGPKLLRQGAEHPRVPSQIWLESPGMSQLTGLHTDMQRWEANIYFFLLRHATFVTHDSRFVLRHASLRPAAMKTKKTMRTSLASLFSWCGWNYKSNHAKGNKRFRKKENRNKEQFKEKGAKRARRPNNRGW